MLLQRANHRRCRQPVKLRRQWIEKYQPPPGENPRHQFCKRGTESFFGTITFGDPSRDLISGPTLEYSPCPCGNIEHRIAQRNFANASAFQAESGQIESFKTAARTEKAMVHFGKVVILCLASQKTGTASVPDAVRSFANRIAVSAL